MPNQTPQTDQVILQRKELDGMLERLKRLEKTNELLEQSIGSEKKTAGLLKNYMPEYHTARFKLLIDRAGKEEKKYVIIGSEPKLLVDKVNRNTGEGEQIARIYLWEKNGKITPKDLPLDEWRSISDGVIEIKILKRNRKEKEIFTGAYVQKSKVLWDSFESIQLGNRVPLNVVSMEEKLLIEMPEEFGKQQMTVNANALNMFC